MSDEVVPTRECRETLCASAAACGRARDEAWHRDVISQNEVGDDLIAFANLHCFGHFGDDQSKSAARLLNDVVKKKLKYEPVGTPKR